MANKKTKTNSKMKTSKRRKRRLYFKLKIFTMVFSAIMLLFALLLFTGPGNSLLINMASSYIYGQLDYVESDKKSLDAAEVLNTQDSKITGKLGKDVVNILLLGIEEIEGGRNTDAMIIATLNKKENRVKLTSLMRDLYVTIPGYDKNRLNSVYAKGGISLLYKSIYDNFGITLDGYAKVGFEAFEEIVDILGGVEVSLTKTEAKYLNGTNYISNPKYRTVVAGEQVLNGNQALGYVRIRKVSTETESSDFGRTQRQRIVLKSMFDTIKSKNIIQVGLVMNEILHNVNIETDISQKQFNQIISQGLNIDIKSFENKRIPSDGTYKDIKIKMGKYNQQMLEPKDWNATRKEIHEYIYGE